MKTTGLLVLGAVLAPAMVACTEHYNKIMQAKVKDALGDDFQKYQAFSYPTDNFGLATMYTSPSGTTVSDADFLCDTWTCIGVPVPSTDQQALMDVNGFAAVGNDGGTISLSEQDQHSLTLNVVLPQIYSVLNISGGYNSSSVTTTKLTLGQAYVRKLRRQPMQDYLDKLPQTSLEGKAYQAGNLTLIVADVVLTSMQVDITVNKSAAPNLDAALQGAPTKVVGNATLGVKMSSSLSGTYSFSVTKPVVVLREAVRQPTAGGLRAHSSDWDDWDPVALPSTVPTLPARTVGEGH